MFGDKNKSIWCSHMELRKPNGLSKHVKGHQVTGLNLSAIAKLAIICIINTRVLLRSNPDVGFNQLDSIQLF